MHSEKITSQSLKLWKGRKQVPSLTTYDYPTTKLLDEAGIPFLLVGDSLGMVVLGYSDTTYVTMADMEHHIRAAARAKPKGLLAADLPYHSYQTAKDAVANGKRLMAAGAEAVKLEGGRSILDQVQALIQENIPVCGHIGMLPQSIREEGSYRVKGKSDPEHQALLEDAKALDQAGVFALVLELVAPPVAAEITSSITAPTIGIGSGRHCDGQILVTPDLVRLSPDYIPKHVKSTVNLAEEMKAAVRHWMNSVDETSPTLVVHHPSS